MQTTFVFTMYFVEWTLKGSDAPAENDDILPLQEEDIKLRKQYCECLIEDNYWYFLVWYLLVD